MEIWDDPWREEVEDAIELDSNCEEDRDVEPGEVPLLSDEVKAMMYCGYQSGITEASGPRRLALW